MRSKNPIPTLVDIHHTRGVGTRRQVYDMFEWGPRDAEIRDKDGKVIFHQEGMSFPTAWSDTAVQIVSQKYFKGPLGSEKREHDLRQMIDRVVDTIETWGLADGYFSSSAEAEAFANELAYLIVDQRGSFNSPVWFNMGTEFASDPEKPQCSACFINSVEDNMDSILDLQVREGKIFKDGSGSGVNLSPLRSVKEFLSGGGRPSGPISFMKALDCFAGQIKSGGKTRRAAKMVILNVDHPDIVEFIACKANEERKIAALLEVGYTVEFNAPDNAYDQIFFQNANNSVRTSRAFMEAALAGDVWETRAVTTGKTVGVHNANELLGMIAAAAWSCGDPGLQFDDTINNWNPVLDLRRINASNPCCFVGETLVDTAEGRIRIEDLELASRTGEDLPAAFAWDRGTNLPVLRQINRAWKAGVTRHLVDVETDKGLVIRCTPEHRFLTFDGTYIPASELRPGVRLRKIGRGVNDDRSGRRYIQHRGTAEVPNGCPYQSRFMWEQLYGPIPKGFEVHHKNEDPTDDRGSNLELMAAVDHLTLHGTGSANPRFIEGDLNAFLEVYNALRSTAKRTHKTNGNLVTVGRWNKHIKTNKLKGVVPVARAVDGVGRIQGKPWGDFIGWLEAQSSAANDRVKSVTYVDLAESVAVYDIEVEGAHNFAVTNSADSGQHTLVVHNSEFLFVDDSSCNLASLNLMKFRTPEGGFDAVEFRVAVRAFIMAQEIMVNRAGYPTPEIERNSHEFRALGLGYANLGALLMSLGVAYDSDRGRHIAAAITSFMTAEAYEMSGEIAEWVGPFEHFRACRTGFGRVIDQHVGMATELAQSAGGLGSSLPSTGIARALMNGLDTGQDPFANLAHAAMETWWKVQGRAKSSGFRNAQVTLLAPTGTIGFMMDCSTTGIEPEFALVKYKSLVGGGQLKLVSPLTPVALRALGYSGVQLAELDAYLGEHGHLEGRSGLISGDLPVFDTSFPALGATRYIAPMGHVKMMAAVQPFLSGAISKTVNLPESATVNEIRDVFIEAWKLGLKSIAVYRNNCKQSQPLNMSKDGKNSPAEKPDLPCPPAPPKQRKMPLTRNSITHKFRLGNHKCYLTVGLYDDGAPGEIFLEMSKEGSTMSGLIDSWATTFSYALQYGVPLSKLVERFSHTRFDPSGYTGELGFASSIPDYVVRWLERRFLKPELPFGDNAIAMGPAPAGFAPDAPPCAECGALMIRNGSCFRCANCGGTSGCS